MIENANAQLKEITIDDIKKVLKEYCPEKYDKMIVSNHGIMRNDFTNIFYKYQKVNRFLNKLIVPGYKAIQKSFTQLLEAPDEKIHIDDLSFSKFIESKGSKILNLRRTEISNAFDFPLDLNVEHVSTSQKIYCFPSESNIDTCNTCVGKKYIKCDDYECDGRHQWTCPTCSGDGKIDCNSCSGEGKLRCSSCKGKGNIKCGGIFSGCGGKGYVMVDNGTYANGTEKPKKEQKCTMCRGKGETRCKNCTGKGKVNCTKCDSKGQVTCNSCSGQKKIVCKKCYGDSNRYGLIDCETCLTQGVVAKLFYVETNVENLSFSKILLTNQVRFLEEIQLSSHIDKKLAQVEVFSQNNTEQNPNYDDFSEEYSSIMRDNLGLTTDDFPKVTVEKISYQIIPCMKFKYKHMLTNTSHEVTIINFWTNPEFIFHTEPELGEVKQSVDNVIKTTKGFFGKLFKTKSFLHRNDRFNEIRLMIYLAKADGDIQESEKEFLAKEISNLKDFTNKEKQELFDLMNSDSPPLLTNDDVTFSSTEKGLSTLKKIKQLAQSDGNIDQSEQELIDRIEALMK